MKFVRLSRFIGLHLIRLETFAFYSIAVCIEKGFEVLNCSLFFLQYVTIGKIPYITYFFRQFGLNGNYKESGSGMAKW